MMAMPKEVQKLFFLSSAFNSCLLGENSKIVEATVSPLMSFLQTKSDDKELETFFKYQREFIREIVFKRYYQSTFVDKCIDEADELFEQSGLPWDTRPTSLMRRLYKEQMSTPVNESIFDPVIKSVLVARDSICLVEDYEAGGLERKNRLKHAKDVLNSNSLGYVISNKYSTSKSLVLVNNINEVYSSKLILDIDGLNVKMAGLNLSCQNSWGRDSFNTIINYELYTGTKKNELILQLNPIDFFLLDLIGIPPMHKRCRHLLDLEYLINLNFNLISKIDEAISK